MSDGLSPTVRYGAPAPAASVLTPRLASRSLYAALAAALLSMVAISLFFGGAGEFWGPVNDVLVVATVLLLVPAVLSTRALAAATAGRWFGGLAVLALAGIAIMAAGQTALVIGLIDLEASFVTGTVGVLMAIAWIAGTGVLGLRLGVLSRTVGWWASGFVLAVLVTALAIPLVTMDTPTLSLVFGGPLLVALAGWMVSLARDLGQRPG